MKRVLIVLSIILIVTVLEAQQTDTLKDTRDGKAYKTVKIGKQVWMAENLNVSTFRNGDAIPEAKTDAEWVRAGEEGKAAWCYYDNNPANGKKYGKLYNWYAVNDPRGLAPKGWHIPTKEELKTLVKGEWEKTETESGEEIEFNVNGNSLKAVGQGTGDGAGTSTSGFSALLAGYRYLSGTFYILGSYAGFWSSTEFNSYRASYLYLYYDDSDITLSNYYKEYGFSARCAKD